MRRVATVSVTKGQKGQAGAEMEGGVSVLGADEAGGELGVVHGPVLVRRHRQEPRHLLLAQRLPCQ